MNQFDGTSARPNWEDAPEWAKHLAMDADGEWWWFEVAPVLAVGDGCWAYMCGQVRRAGNGIGWTDSLESRP
jgi:hypothetical protein